MIKKIICMLLIAALCFSGCTKEEEKEIESENIENEVENTEEEESDEAEEIVLEVDYIDITISAAGDVTLGNYQGQGYDNSFNQTFEKIDGDYKYFFKNVYDIFSQDDFTIVNLEGMLTTSEDMAAGRTFNIKGKPEYKNILVEGDIEGVSMENNHRRDWGAQGTTDTVEALESVDISYAYEDVLGYYEVDGIMIGWISVNPASFGDSVEHFIVDGMSKLKSEGVDLIFVCCHWGIEKDNYPTDYQQKLGKMCIDLGADLVIGHHPHVLQGIEEYNGKYIIYSLANFSFGANKNPSDKDTMIFQQTFRFERTKVGDEVVELKKVEDKNAKIIPCSISSVSNKNDYCPTPLVGEEGQRVIDRVNKYSESFGVTIDENGVIN